MPATITQARDEMFQTVKDFWDGEASAPNVIIYQDTPKDRPKDVVANVLTPWAIAHVQHNISPVTSLPGVAGQVRYTSFGFLTIELHYPQGDGLVGSDAFAQLLVNALRGVYTTNGVILRNPRMIEAGQEGVWHKVNVVADFEYDQIS